MQRNFFGDNNYLQRQSCADWKLTEIYILGDSNMIKIETIKAILHNRELLWEAFENFYQALIQIKQGVGYINIHLQNFAKQLKKLKIILKTKVIDGRNVFEDNEHDWQH